MSTRSQIPSRRVKHCNRSETGTVGPKLRASCDNCHAAKVKCTPANAESCARCLSHNVRCSYSPSLRVGKSNSSTKSSASSSFAQSRRPSTGVDAESASGRSTPARAQTSHTGYMDDSASTFPDDLSLGDGYMQGLGLDPIAFLPTAPASSSITALNSPNEYLASPWGDQNHLHTNLRGESSQHDSHFLWSTGALDTYSEKQGSSLPAVQKQGYRRYFNGQPTVEGGSPFAAENAVPEKGEESAGSGDWSLQFGDICDCHGQLLQALRIPPRVIKAARTSKDTAVAAFDVLLAANKQSIRRCAMVLDCQDGFGGSTSYLLVFTLLSQVLTLYHSACQSYLVNPSVTPDNDSRESSIVPGPSTLNFGAYKLDQEDEILLKKELMLIELRKVESLLSRLKSLVGEVDDRTECSAYEALLLFSMRNLQQLVTIIQPRR